MTSSTVPQSTTSVELSWEEAMTGTLPETAWRAAFRQAVAEVAEKARAALGSASNGRIDSAVRLVLAGDVKLLEDGSARVASQSNGTTSYFQVNGQCTCKDFPKAPANFCKHRLGFGLAKRATALAQQRLAASNGQPPEEEPVEASSTTEPTPASQALVSPPPAEACTLPPLPEAASSINLYLTIAGYKVQLTLRDMDEHRLLERLAAIVQRFPAPVAEAPPASSKPAEPPATEGWCRLHDVEMRQWPGKDGRKAWYSHRLDSGEWCKGK